MHGRTDGQVKRPHLQRLRLRFEDLDTSHGGQTLADLSGIISLSAAMIDRLILSTDAWGSECLHRRCHHRKGEVNGIDPRGWRSRL